MNASNKSVNYNCGVFFSENDNEKEITFWAIWRADSDPVAFSESTQDTEIQISFHKWWDLAIFFDTCFLENKSKDALQQNNFVESSNM